MGNKLDRFVYYACGSVNYDLKTQDDISTLYEHFGKFIESYSKISKYYFIAHTETKTLHIHFVFYLSSQVRLMTLFNKMSDYLVFKYHDTRDSDGINIQKCDSINAYLRYMLHQDDSSKRENKKRYEIEDIISNDDIDIIETLIQSRKGDIDAYYLRDCVLDCSDEFELMNKLGLKVYHKYRYEILTLREMRVKLAYDRDKERNDRIDSNLPF